MPVSPPVRLQAKAQRVASSEPWPYSARGGSELPRALYAPPPGLPALALIVEGGDATPGSDSRAIYPGVSPLRAGG